MKTMKSIKELYIELNKIQRITNVLSLKDDVISINFHSDFILTIKQNIYFDIFFNNVFYYNIEDQDILGSLMDIIQNDYIFIERKNIFGKKKISMISEREFIANKEKWLEKEKAKIYSKETTYLK